VIALFGFASFASLREFLTLTPTRRADHLALAIAFFLVLPFQYYLIWLGWYELYSIFIPVYAFLLLPIAAALRGDTTAFMSRVAEVQWGLMICVFCLSHVPALLTLDIPGYEGRQLLLIGFVVIVVQSNDVLQYVWGKLLGRRKIKPEELPPAEDVRKVEKRLIVEEKSLSQEAKMIEGPKALQNDQQLIFDPGDHPAKGRNGKSTTHAK